MYLSRLILNPASHQVRSELAHPYEMHRTLMRAFPDLSEEDKRNARETFNMLFRPDIDEHHNRVIVHVQSTVKPNWTFLYTRNGYLDDRTDSSNPACKDVGRSYGQLKSGQVLMFRLRANPTKRIGKVTKGDADLKGKRVGLLREEEQVEWLIRKGQEWDGSNPGGFEILMKEIEDHDGTIITIPRVNVRREGKQTARKKENGNPRTTTHLAVRFDGLLRITDADAFRETLTRGVGSGKAFGFGLLSIAPVRFSVER